MGILELFVNLFLGKAPEMNPAEKRKHTRANIQNLVAHKPISSSNFSISNLSNIGEGGILFYVNHQYKTGELLDLELKFLQRESVVKAKVKVLWCNLGKKSGRYATGCEFVEISSEDMQFIKNNIMKIVEGIEKDRIYRKKADRKIKSKLKRKEFFKRLADKERPRWV